MSRLSIRLLGPPQFVVDGLRLDLDHRKPAALFAFLAVTRNPHTRASLASMFWPDAANALAYLRNSLYLIRKALGDSHTNWLVITSTQVGMAADGDIWLDSTVFQNYLDSFRLHQHSPDALCPDCVTALSKAVDTYQDEFLAGFTLRDSPAFNDWAFFERERLRDELAVVLTALATYHGHQRQFDYAIEYARRRLTLDPLHEPAHRQLMQLYADNGHHSLAARQYEECRRLLEAEFSAQPDLATQQLLALIQQQMPSGTLSADGDRGGPRYRSEPTPARVTGSSAAPRPSMRHNLSAPLTSLVGRERECLEIKTIMTRPEARLLTLTGPGGVGKTRLSEQVAWLLATENDFDAALFPDGVFFVSLAPIREPQLVISAIAQELGVRESPNRKLIEGVKSTILDKRILLILDNFEHLLDAATLVSVLLRASPNLRVLATSRQVLHLSGEHEFRILPLALPAIDGSERERSAAKYSAIELFFQRARAAKHDFVMDGHTEVAVVELCRRLDGLPLAIELAAARIKYFSVSEVLARMEGGNNLSDLANPVRDVADRHHSLWAAIKWSYALLSGDEQILFRRVSIFVDGWQPNAVAAICMGDLASDVYTCLASLQNKSLINRRESERGESRYFMLETLREFGLEQLRQCGEHPTLQRAYASYYTELAERYNNAIYGPGDTVLRLQLEAEYANIRSVMAWAIANEEVDIALRLCNALLHFWHGLSNEAERFTTASLAAAEGKVLVSEPLIGTLVCAGVYSFGTKPPSVTRRFMQRSLEMEAALGIRVTHRRMGIARDLLAGSYMLEGEYDKAREAYADVIAYARQWGDEWDLAMILVNAGRAMTSLGEFEQADKLFDEALILHRKVGQTWSLTKALIDLSTLHVRCGRFDVALAALREAEQLLGPDQPSDRNRKMLFFSRFGLLFMEMGKLLDASAWFRQALALDREGEVSHNVVLDLVEMIARLLLQQGNHRSCLELMAATSTLRRELRLIAAPVEKAIIDDSISRARSLMQQDMASKVWKQGAAMSLQEIMQCALNSL